MLCIETSPSSSVRKIDEIIESFEVTTKTITHPIPCETFPAPSNDVTAVPALPDAVAGGEASTVDEFEVSVACTSACFGLCRDDDFQVPRGKNLLSKKFTKQKLRQKFP